MPSEKDVRARMTVPPISSVEELEDNLSAPTPGLIEAMRRLKGDLLLLGTGGKVGPCLARCAVRAREASGQDRRIIGVDAFPDAAVRAHLDALGVETVQADLLAPGAFDALPDAENVLYMVGRKFGSTGAEWQTWHTNVFLTGLAAQRYQRSRIVAFSSGNIYPFVPVGSGGALESTAPAPIGEYAMSCLGRERMLDQFANEAGARVLHFRLNYAAELRYGVLYDVATKVWNDAVIELTMGHFNAVWQGYVANVALQCFELAESPARALNITGPETISIRWLATRFGELMDKTPRFEGEERSTALLSNASQCFKRFGYPDVSLDTLIEWLAYWVAAGGANLGKPTHYETRDGKF